jgi:hypothetical protein
MKKIFLILLILFGSCVASGQIVTVTNSGTGTGSTITGAPSSANQAAYYLELYDCVGCGIFGPNPPWINVVSSGHLISDSQFFTSTSPTTVTDSWTGSSQWITVLSFFPGTNTGLIQATANEFTSGPIDPSITTSVSSTLGGATGAGDQFFILVWTTNGNFTAGVNDTDGGAYYTLVNKVFNTLQLKVFICFSPIAGNTPTITLGLGGVGTVFAVFIEVTEAGGSLTPPGVGSTSRIRSQVINWPDRFMIYERRRWLISTI